MLAFTMIRHDSDAGLFAPTEPIVIEKEHGQSSLTYVNPSSLMVVEASEPRFAAAQSLDAKLHAPVEKVTAKK